MKRHKDETEREHALRVLNYECAVGSHACLTRLARCKYSRRDPRHGAAVPTFGLPVPRAEAFNCTLIRPANQPSGIAVRRRECIRLGRKGDSIKYPLALAQGGINYIRCAEVVIMQRAWHMLPAGCSQLHSALPTTPLLLWRRYRCSSLIEFGAKCSTTQATLLLAYKI